MSYELNVPFYRQKAGTQKIHAGAGVLIFEKIENTAGNTIRRILITNYVTAEDVS